MFGKKETSAVPVAGAFESELRAALRDAIRVRDQVAGQVEASRAAVLRVEDQLFEAHRKLREAQASAGEEQERLVQEIVAGGSATLLERANGRALEVDAEHEIEACKSARDLCRAALANAERSLDFKQRLLGDAVNAVLATAAPRLIEKAETVRDELIGLASVLRYFRSSVSETQRRRIDEVTAFPTDFDRSHPALAVWQAAAEALARDSDALLPPGKDDSL